MKVRLLCSAVILLLTVSAFAQSKLHPSANYWDHDDKNVAVRISRLSRNRKLAMAGDTLYMLNNRNRIVWSWTTGGAPLTDFPVIDSHGVLYAIAFDLIWVALDAKTGVKLWQSTANGGAVFSQITLYKNDMYLVVVDMTGYRQKNLGWIINDKLYLCLGTEILWATEIPAGSGIKIRAGRVFAVYRAGKRNVRHRIKIPKIAARISP